MADTRSFQKGAAAAKAAASTTSFVRTGFFSLDDEEQAWVQFITDCDEWITNIDVHSMVPTKKKPSDFQGDKWPEKVSAVCRLTTMGDGLPIHSDCYVCENVPDPHDSNKAFKKTVRTYSLGVILEEVIGDGSEERGGENKKGKRIGFKMKMTKMVDPETKIESMVPEVRVFMFGWTNFYAALEGAAQVNDSTIANLAFAIKRTGKGLDTKYVITSMGVQARDFNDEKHLDKLGIKLEQGEKVYPDRYNLSKMVLDRASDDYYARFIDPTKTPAKREKDGEQVATPKQSNDAEPADLEAMRSRILGYNEASAPQDAEPAGVAAGATPVDFDEA